MTKQQLKMSVNIAHTNGFDENSVRLTIVDDKSRIQFINIKMSLKDYGKLVLGLGDVSLNATAVNLENVGKKRESKAFIFEIEDKSYGLIDKITLRDKLNSELEEWEIVDDLSSRDSFFKKDDKRYVRVNAYRWHR